MLIFLILFGYPIRVELCVSMAFEALREPDAIKAFFKFTFFPCYYMNKGQ